MKKMTNFEKYYQKILNETPGHDISCHLYKARTGSYSCYEYANCTKCRIASFKWLGEEYKEPEVDWSKVPRGTKVFVWDYNDKAPLLRKFFAYDPSFTAPFLAVNRDESGVSAWKYCELAEDE